MDPAAIDHVARAIATRRTLAQALAALPLVGAGGALLSADGIAARRRQRRRQASAHAEKKHKKAKTVAVCLNGQTVQASKKKRKALMKQGATPGACAASGPTPASCSPACAPGQRCCNLACVAGPWQNQAVFGSAGSGTNNFQTPAGVAISPDGLTTWIVDQLNNRVVVWSRPAAASTAWTYQTTFGSNGVGPSNVAFPTRMAVTPDGRTALIADTNNHRIVVWTRPSAASTVWGNESTFGERGSGINQLIAPSGIAVSPDGLIAAVSDTGNHRVSIWSRPSLAGAWSPQTRFGSNGTGAGNFFQPSGLAMSADARSVFVADFVNKRVSVWSRPSPTSAFAPESRFGSAGNGPGQFSAVIDVAVTSDTLTVFACDSLNDRIAVWARPSAGSAAWTELTTLGALGSAPAQLDKPSAVAITPDGLTVSIADRNNNRVSVWAMACPA